MINNNYLENLFEVLCWYSGISSEDMEMLKRIARNAAKKNKVEETNKKDKDGLNYILDRINLN